MQNHVATIQSHLATIVHRSDRCRDNFLRSSFSYKIPDGRGPGRQVKLFGELNRYHERGNRALVIVF